MNTEYCMCQFHTSKRFFLHFFSVNSPSFGVDFTNVFARIFRTQFLYERLFSSYVQKTRAKNARENVGEIDPWSPKV